MAHINCVFSNPCARANLLLAGLAKGISPRLQLIDRYLDQIKTLKKPNTHRKYDAVLTRFAKVFDRRTLDSILTEDLNDYVVALMKSGMSANTVLHNVVIIAQFCKRNGRPGLTRLLHLPERISPLPLEYTEEELASFFEVTTDRERELFSTFLLTGFREQEVAFPLLERH